MPPTPICPKHKNYQGKRRPKNGCSRCQDVYDYLHGELHPKKMKEMDAQMMVSTPIPCKKHPKYKAIRKPKNCSDCWKFYNAKHGIVDLSNIETKQSKNNNEVKAEPINEDKENVIDRWEKLEAKYLGRFGDVICPATGASYHLITYDPKTKIALVIQTVTRGIHIKELKKLKVIPATVFTSTPETLKREEVRQQFYKDLESGNK